MAKLLQLAVAAVVLTGAEAKAKVVIEAMKHDIQQITPSNFDGIISKFRDSAIAAVWFFDADEKSHADFLDEYNKVAGDLKGMAKICAVNCGEFALFCDKIKEVKDARKQATPTIMIYPVNPMPAFKYEGKMEAKGISGKVAKFMPDQSVRLTQENIDQFSTTNPSTPKVILFSNKKSVPVIWKALSSETVFRRTVKFGFVTEDQTELITRFKVTKYPTVISQRGAKAEIKENYKGEMNFLALKDWVNLRSESGMGDKVGSGGSAQEESIEEAKPWLVQEVPELTGKSQSDICFKGEGLCVIYLKDGEISAAETNMLEGLSKKFTSQLSDRGAKMKWMWMNVAIEEAYKTLFATAQLPSAVVFNPHKRLRFTSMDHGEDNEIKSDETALTKLMDKVLGGDARFKMVPGQKLPSWAQRAEPAKGGKKEL